MLVVRKINQGSALFQRCGFAEGGLTKHVLHVYTWRSQVRKNSFSVPHGSRERNQK